MKTNYRMSNSKTEGYTPIRPTTRGGETDETSYFPHTRKHSSAGNGSATSDSEVSPFGVSKPPTLMRRPQYTKEQKSGAPEACIVVETEAVSLSGRRSVRCDQSWPNPTTTNFMGRDRDTSESTGHRESFTPQSQVGGTSGHPADPPRPAREGMEWVWFPEGYWAERERKEMFMTESKHRTIQKWFNRIPDTRLISPFQDQSPGGSPTKTLIPRIKIGSINTRKSSSRGSSRRHSERHSEPVRNSSLKKRGRNMLSLSNGGEQERLSLLSRTKKTFEARILGKQPERSQESSDEEKGPASRTATLLHGTTHPLELFEQQQIERQKTEQRLLAIHPPASPDGRRRGLAPWHRRQSHESLLSVSSSIYKILMGKSPMATPASHPSSGGSGGSGGSGRIFIRTAPKSDPIAPHGNTFLPTEAKRINTPPMAESVLAKSPAPSHSATGYFSNASPMLSSVPAKSPAPGYSEPGYFSDASPMPSSVPAKSPAVPGYFFDATPMLSPAISCIGDHDPMDVSSGTSVRSRTANRRSKLMKRISRSGLGRKSTDKSANAANTMKFEINIPEHFPNSPLCPRNPKHKSGGRGVCVYHGRREDNSAKST